MRLSKLIGLCLAGGCVFLLALSGLLISGALTTMETTENVDALPLSADTDNLIASVGDTAGMEGYGVISQKPLFNESREPELPEPPVEGEGTDGEEDEVAQAEPLDVSVNGIIITPDLRLAIVTDNKTNTRMRVREGMPLEEDMAAWTLDSIEPRKLTFSDGDSSESVVEMSVDSKGAPAPAPNRTAEEPVASEDGAEESADAGSARERQAEEIRRRVAERRAQLRAEAERRRAEQNKEQ